MEIKKTEGLVAQMDRITDRMMAMKAVVVIVAALAFVTVAGCSWFFLREMRTVRSQVYVIADGAAFRANGQDVSVTRGDEVADHVRRFHELVFNLPPEYTMIRRNLERALVLCDKSVYDYYNDLQEKSFYERLVNSGAYQQIEFSGVDVDMDTYPYGVTVTGFLYINRLSNISKYSFTSQCLAENSVRSAENLHGIMLSRFRVISSELLETREK